MNTRHALVMAASLACLCVLPARAQTETPPPPAAPAAPTAPAAPVAPAPTAAPVSGLSTQPAESAEDRGEPQVQRSVIEDEGSRIEELKVRGQTTRISVASKLGNAKGYEIIPSEVGRAHWTEGSVPASGAAGKSVWHVLSF